VAREGDARRHRGGEVGVSCEHTARAAIADVKAFGGSLRVQRPGPPRAQNRSGWPHQRAKSDGVTKAMRSPARGSSFCSGASWEQMLGRVDRSSGQRQ